VQIKRLRRANGCAAQVLRTQTAAPRKRLRRTNQMASPRKTAAPCKTASPSKCFDKQTTLRHK